VSEGAASGGFVRAALRRAAAAALSATAAAKRSSDKGSWEVGTGIRVERRKVGSKVGESLLFNGVSSTVVVFSGRFNSAGGVIGTVRVGAGGIVEVGWSFGEGGLTGEYTVRGGECIVSNGAFAEAGGVLCKGG
jgi:hypothetical protein